MATQSNTDRGDRNKERKTDRATNRKIYRSDKNIEARKERYTCDKRRIDRRDDRKKDT